jgi:hypothetical protein
MKKIKITLKRRQSGLGEPYQLVKLVNATAIQSTHGRTVHHYVGDCISEEQAETLIDNKRYEVTITL